MAFVIIPFLNQKLINLMRVKNTKVFRERIIIDSHENNDTIYILLYRDEIS